MRFLSSVVGLGEGVLPLNADLAYKPSCGVDRVIDLLRLGDDIVCALVSNCL